MRISNLNDHYSHSPTQIIKTHVDYARRGRVAILCLVLLIGGGGTFAYFYLQNHRIGGPQVDNEMFACLPSETNFIVNVEFEELLQNAKIKDFVTTELPRHETEFFRKLKETGLSEDDFSRILVGACVDKTDKMFASTPAGKSPPPPPPKKDEIFVTVVRAKKPFDKSKISQVFGLKEQTNEGKVYYRALDNLFISFPREHLIVLASSEKTATELANKDPNKVVLSEEMMDLSRSFSAKGQVWFAMSKSAFEAEKKPGWPRPSSFMSRELIDVGDGWRGVGFGVKLDEKSLSVSGGILCQNPSIAEKGAIDAQKQIDAWRKDKSLR
jgi:hypothetical protein